jgi:hypothetical protein
MDEIIEVGNGDIRKVLLSLYRYQLEQSNNRVVRQMDRNERADYLNRVKNEQKCPIFHLLGKYLYAKRYDVAQKKIRYFSR